jgi:hypothetical protein
MTAPPKGIIHIKITRHQGRVLEEIVNQFGEQYDNDQMTPWLQERLKLLDEIGEAIIKAEENYDRNGGRPDTRPSSKDRKRIKGNTADRQIG